MKLAQDTPTQLQLFTDFGRPPLPDPMPTSEPPDPPPAKIMLVHGLGRSCTSGVARALHLTGWPMAADEEDLLPPHVSNPWGHYEDRRAVELNERILYDMGGYSWDQPPPISALHHKATQYTSWVQEYVRGRVSHHGLFINWGVKDPRITLLLPIWEAAFRPWSHEVEPIFVHVSRWEHRVQESYFERDRKPTHATSLMAAGYREHARTFQM